MESPASIAPPPRPWRRRGFARGFLVFLVCTAAGLAAVRGRADWSAARAVLAAAPGWMLAGGIAQAMLDQALGGLRLWACARALGERVSLRVCVGANCANVFLGGVTPSQSGGGPAQIWLLTRGGLSFAAAAVTSACTFLGTIATFLVLAVHLVLVPVAGIEGAALRVFTSGTVFAFGLCLAAGLGALLRPRWVYGPLRHAVAQVPRWGPAWAAGERFRSLQRLSGDAAPLLGRGFRRGRGWLALGLFLSFAVYANKFAIAWTVLRGFGVPASLGAVLHGQELQYLVTYFAPTPGASGFAEYSAARLLAGWVPESVLGAYLVTWRTFSLYVGMAMGAAVLLRAAGSEARMAVARAGSTGASGAAP